MHYSRWHFRGENDSNKASHQTGCTALTAMNSSIKLFLGKVHNTTHRILKQALLLLVSSTYIKHYVVKTQHSIN